MNRNKESQSHKQQSTKEISLPSKEKKAEKKEKKKGNQGKKIINEKQTS